MANKVASARHSTGTAVEGYHFYELAPSLLIRNPKLPIYQINPEYTFEMMCEAICKIEGFRYQPEGVFHGHSSEEAVHSHHKGVCQRRVCEIRLHRPGRRPSPC